MRAAPPLADDRPTTGVVPALVVLALLNVMWGGSLPATKVALEGFGPFTLAAARLLLASLLFLAVLGPSLPAALRTRAGWVVAGLGVIGFAGTQSLQALGSGGTSSATATVLASTGPVWIALLAPALLRERPTRPGTVGILLALAGVAVVLAPGSGPLLSGSLVGGATVLLSSLAFALYSVLSKAAGGRYPPLLLGGLGCLAGALATLPLAALELAAAPPSPTPLSWLMVAYLGVCVTFVGFALWLWGLRAVPVARAGAFLFLQPLSGLALSALALGDQLSPGFLLGTGLVLVGVWLAARAG